MHDDPNRPRDRSVQGCPPGGGEWRPKGLVQPPGTPPHRPPEGAPDRAVPRPTPPRTPATPRAAPPPTRVPASEFLTMRWLFQLRGAGRGRGGGRRSRPQPVRRRHRPTRPRLRPEPRREGRRRRGQGWAGTALPPPPHRPIPELEGCRRPPPNPTHCQTLKPGGLRHRSPHPQKARRSPGRGHPGALL